MKTVLLRGPTTTQSGYGKHASQLARWLLQKNIDLRFQLLPWGNTSWVLNRDDQDGLIGKIQDRSNHADGNVYDVTFQLQLPSEWDPSLGKFNVGLSAVVETDRCHSDWVSACNRMNLVIVPSEHAKKCLLNSGTVTVPLLVVPEAFPDACLTQNVSNVELPTFSTQFNFLVFGQLTSLDPLTDRKNTYNCIKWLFETFKDKPDVGVILKTNLGRNTAIDRSDVVNVLTQMIASWRPGSWPRLHLLHGDMSDDEVTALYRHPQVKCLVSPTRGEGFGLPLLEAASCGLPVIATGWSAHTEFLGIGKYIDLNYTLTSVPKQRVDNKIFVEGVKWAEVSEVDFKRRVSKFYSSPSTPKEWALDLQKKLQQTHSFSSIASQYDAAVRSVGVEL